MSSYRSQNINLSQLFLPLSQGIQALTGTNYNYFDTKTGTNKDINTLYSAYVNGSYANPTNYFSTNYGKNDLNKIFQNINNPINKIYNATGTYTEYTYGSYTGVVFTDSGTFTFTQDKTATIIVIGGGGGGGSGNYYVVGGISYIYGGGGGGGGGGVIVANVNFPINTNYTVTVGTGGIGGIANSGPPYGTSGTLSTLSGNGITYTSNGGTAGLSQGSVGTGAGAGGSVNVTSGGGGGGGGGGSQKSYIGNITGGTNSASGNPGNAGSDGVRRGDTAGNGGSSNSLYQNISIPFYSNSSSITAGGGGSGGAGINLIAYPGNAGAGVGGVANIGVNITSTYQPPGYSGTNDITSGFGGGGGGGAGWGNDTNVTHTTPPAYPSYNTSGGKGGNGTIIIYWLN